MDGVKKIETEAERAERIRGYKRAYAARNRAKIAAKNNAWNKANPEKMRRAAARYAKKHRDKVRAIKNAWNRAHPEKARERTARWNAANQERRKAVQAAYRRNNAGKIETHRSLRRAASLQATPKWAEQFFIDEIYDLARRRTEITGYEWHVDHIVPLRAPTVCGLHVHNNLRVIPGALNKSKGNRHWPDMP